MRHWDKLLFVLGLALAVFGYGVIVGKYEVFPFEFINRGKDAAKALMLEMNPEDNPYLNSPRNVGGVTRWDRNLAVDRVTLIAEERDGMTHAILLDMEGKELHRWQILFSSVWPQAEHLLSQGPDGRFIWHGMHLYSNGDLLFNFEAGGFPAGAGLVLIDKDSKVKWKLARNTHHDLHVQPDGRIVVSAHEYNTQGLAACKPFFQPPYVEDVVLTVSPDGQVLDRVSVLETMCGSPIRAKLMVQGHYGIAYDPARRSYDPLHLNNVDVVSAELAANWPMAKAGDVLISLRDMNFVGFLDLRTREIGWSMVGPFVRQHDPDLMPNGHLLVFDNLGGGGAGGRTRILEIDPATQRIVWKYQGTATDPFNSGKGGKQELLPNGNVLITEAWGGRVFEVTRDPDPKIVWEYVDLLEKKGDGGVVGAVLAANRFARSDLTFLPSP